MGRARWDVRARRERSFGATPEGAPKFGFLEGFRDFVLACQRSDSAPGENSRLADHEKLNLGG